MADALLGKFRGTVADNADPELRGRLRVNVTGVHDYDPSSWALPAFPLAGSQLGVFAVPRVGARVWLEFEQGDINTPIWTGCFYDTAADVPDEALTGPPGSPNIVVQTGGGHRVVLSDLPGGPGISVTHASGAKIEINDSGITLDNGKGAVISLSATQVDINKGALTVK
ncbi:phage baseplate assembly protein V [Mangrovihabitans endophyticus]|uniref:Baseplate assembly protein n=1 Tax=Mangrovihabitans endophyticus TaxID=1751298 RepID=A0A8J3FL45_9ACTN|nr:phage baseplate assembly protein V [Mangrovihabitans endophyticus]GGK74559.1 baseplate assembly protein [Mangrovihabitans endophyticus]